MNNSNVAIAVNKTVSIIQMIAGIASIFIFGLCTIIYLTDKEFAAETGLAFLIVCVVFDVLGIWLISLSKNKNKLIKEFRKYVAAISKDPNGSISNIASSLGTSEDEIISNLEVMIKKKFFSNAFIDRNSNCIVITNRQAVAPISSTTQPKAYDAYTTNSAVGPEMVTVKCKGCGGINAIVQRQVGECDYCGSVIIGE